MYIATPNSFYHIHLTSRRLSHQILSCTIIIPFTHFIEIQIPSFACIQYRPKNDFGGQILVFVRIPSDFDSSNVRIVVIGKILNFLQRIQEVQNHLTKVIQLKE